MLRAVASLAPDAVPAQLLLLRIYAAPLVSFELR